jgi:hypothetical protein
MTGFNTSLLIQYLSDIIQYKQRLKVQYRTWPLDTEYGRDEVQVS